MQQAEVNRRMLPWGEREIKRFIFRLALFMRRGFSEAEAERWADRLALRDQEFERVHLCIECSNWQQSRTCFKRLPMSFDQLIRCGGFEWQKP